jgi:hypothetical protein
MDTRKSSLLFLIGKPGQTAPLANETRRQIKKPMLAFRTGSWEDNA